MSLKIIKSPNRHFGSAPKPGVHVVLPMKDDTHLDLVARFNKTNLIWKLEPLAGFAGNNYILSKTGEHLYPSDQAFLSILSEHYPEDLEFFLWHTEVFEGKYYGGKE